MRAICVVTSVVAILALAVCSSRVQQTKDIEPRTAGDDQDKKSDLDLMEIMTECNDTFRIEMSYIEALNSSGSFLDETDKTPKCFIRCVLEKSGVTSDGEEFDVDRSTDILAQVRKTTPASGIRDIASNCTKRAESCKCERSYQYLKCLMETEIDKYET